MSEPISPRQVCTRCVLNSSFPRIHFDDHGVCSVCHEYDNWWGQWNLRKHQQQKILKKIVKQAKNKHRAFDALIPLSGGKDSTYVLYVAQEKLGLKCLAYTLDIGYLSDHARNNVDRACRKMGVEHLYYCMDPGLMNRLFELFMRKTGWFCSVCMRAIQVSTFKIADMYNIPLVIKGTSLRTELPLALEMFQGGDPAHVQSVLKGEPIAEECSHLCSRGASLQRELGQLLFMLLGQRRIASHAYFNLADYVEWDYDTIHQTISKELAWTAPSDSEHMDCTIHPLQKYIHNARFPELKIRRLSFSRLVMAGQMTRDKALHKLEDEESDPCPGAVMTMFLKNTGMTKEEFDKYVKMGPRHLDYHPQPGLALKLAKKILPIRDAGTL
jgi:hypothetical protein